MSILVFSDNPLGSFGTLDALAISLGSLPRRGDQLRAADRRLLVRAVTVAKDLCRVEICLASTHPDVEPITRGAESLSLLYPFAPAPTVRRDARVRHPQTVTMAHRDVQSPSHGPGEADDSIGSSPESRAWLRREFKPTIARSVRVVRRPERVDHGAAHRPDVTKCRHSRLGHRLRPRRPACDNQNCRCADGQRCHCHNSKCCVQARGCADSYTSLRRSVLTRV